MTADKDALLRELLRRAVHYLSQTDNRGAHELCTRITAALAEKDDGWIKCSERLPTDDSPVLVATKDNVYRSFYYRDHWLMPSIGTVTHWRPLPPLPKGDE